MEGYTNMSESVAGPRQRWWGMMGLMGALLIATSATGFGAFHTHLKRADPANGAHLTAPPAAIRLWFSEKPELAVTTVKLTRANGTSISLDPLKMTDATDTAAVVAGIKSPLPAGSYTVAWRVMARDGHPSRGTFSFVVDGTAGSPGATKK